MLLNEICVISDCFNVAEMSEEPPADPPPGVVTRARGALSDSDASLGKPPSDAQSSDRVLRGRGGQSDSDASQGKQRGVKRKEMSEGKSSLSTQSDSAPAHVSSSFVCFFLCFLLELTIKQHKNTELDYVGEMKLTSLESSFQNR